MYDVGWRKEVEDGGWRMENGGRSMGKVGLIVKFWNVGCMILDG